MDTKEFTFIKLTHESYVATIQLNRPEVLNALNFQLMEEVIAALDMLEDDPETRCVVLTGNERAFAAGAWPVFRWCRRRGAYWS